MLKFDEDFITFSFVFFFGIYWDLLKFIEIF